MRVTLFAAAVVSVLLFQNCTSKNDALDDAKNNSALTVLSESPIFSFNRLLWVGAHPDDEIPSSGLLKEFCSRPGKSCVLVSLTKGEKGQCKLAEGCTPDLVTVRSSEFSEAGQYLSANVEQREFRDGSSGTPEGTLSVWSNNAGSSEKLVSSMQNLILQINPDVVLTFDPRHGTSCHPDHRATAMLTITAAQAAGVPMSSIFMVESVIIGVAGSTTPGFRPAVLDDINTQSYSTANYWEDLVYLAGSVYRSQYYPSEVTAFSGISNEGRTLSLLTADNAIENDPKYSRLCP